MTTQVPAPVLQKVASEELAHAADPERLAPTVELLSHTDPVVIEHLVFTAPQMLLRLQGAASPLSEPAVFSGTPVRELSVTLPLQASKKDSANIGDYRDNLVLWIDSKNIPLAYREDIHAKFCKFFLCLTMNERFDGKLQVIDGRLVTAALTREVRQSGLGEDSDDYTAYHLRLQTSGGAAATFSTPASAAGRRTPAARRGRSAGTGDP